MQLRRATVTALFAAAGIMRRDGASVSVAAVCTVEGGVACRLAQGRWDDPGLSALTSRLVAEIGWKTIEHAAGRQVAIRCVAPGGDATRAACSIDLGAGFEPLPVTAEAGDG
jgi:hypothetical protein